MLTKTCDVCRGAMPTDDSGEVALYDKEGNCFVSFDCCAKCQHKVEQALRAMSPKLQKAKRRE